MLNREASSEREEVLTAKGAITSDYITMRVPSPVTIEKLQSLNMAGAGLITTCKQDCVQEGC